MRPGIAAVVSLLTGVTLLTVAEASRQPESWWPQFRGPTRDGIAPGRNLLPGWPEGGPPLVWSVSGIGRGWSSPIVVGNRFYVTGDRGNDLWIQAFDLAGRRVWQKRNGRAWTGPYPGARASCTYADGRLFHLNAHGRLVCLDATNGREQWAVNILDRFGGEVIRWGLSECVLVDQGRVIVTPGGRNALMAALDVSTGKAVWTTPPLMFLRTRDVGGRKVDPPRRAADRAGYASPVVVRVGSRRFYAGVSGRHVFLVDAADGALVWKQYVPVHWEVIGSMPVVVGPGRVLFAAPDVGAWCVQVRENHGVVAVEERWRTKVDNCHGGFVLLNDQLYGAGYRLSRGWFCLDTKTGAVRYRSREFAKGSAIAADGRLYVLAENGVVALLTPGEEGFTVRGTFRLGGGRGSDVWAHPVLADRRLYLRRHGRLWCFEVRKR